jgi:PAS domain S-box-containing protein
MEKESENKIEPTSTCKEILEKLKDSEIRYRRLFEAAKDGVLILDGYNGQIVDVNPYLTDLLGYNHKELLGKELWEIGVFKNIVASKNAFKELQDKEYIHFEDMPLETKEGKPIDVEFVSNVYEVDHTKVIQCNIRNITERKQAIRKLQDSEIRYRRLFEAAKDGVLILDADKGEIVDVNPYLIEILGYTRKELLGKELWEIGIFRNIVASKNAFKELQDKEYIHFEDMPLETKEGKSINVEFVSNVYKVDNTKVIQCNIRNITERKQAEEQLAKYQKQLIELNSTKDKLFSIIAHDLRSPFSAIIGFSELLYEKMNKIEYEEFKAYVENISSSAKQTLELLENLLNWAQAQTGQISFNPQILNMQDIILDVINSFGSSAALKSLTLNYSIPAQIVVFADQNMLKTVLHNLVSNAIKFSNQGGEIFIQSELYDSFVEITVSDEGIGMTEDSRNKLFDIDKVTTSKGTANEKGSGLGLILCKEFVEKNGGEIWVKSEIGKGSKFTFTIPLGGKGENA